LRRLVQAERGMKLLFATSNPHKLTEARAILAPQGIVLVSLEELGVSAVEPEEDGVTFEDNAALKARYYARVSGELCLAEDSGIEVDALGGAPGVYSARYSGVEGDRATRDGANNAKLLAALEQVPEQARTARFVCAACVATPDGTLVCTSRGAAEGRIISAPRGAAGFGYDPLFWLERLQCTTAELPEAEKNALSHRAVALRMLGPALMELLGRAAVKG
jgi:XTP/dITP diphosphohydrolase